MTFGNIFWRIFLIIVLIAVGSYVLGYMFPQMGWLFYAGIGALIITGIFFLVNNTRRRRRR